MSNFRGVAKYFHCFPNSNRTFCDPNQTSHYAICDLDLHCLPMLHEMDAKRLRVKQCLNAYDKQFYANCQLQNS